MTLEIYNTLTKRTEEFIPIDDKKVRMYVCGVTVYNDIHMGHARSIIVFDMVARYLRYKGYEVKHVTNFTDVDDKIINKANEMGMDPLALSKMYIEHYFEDLQKLGVKSADIYPKASESIDDIIRMVQKIIDAGYGYVAEDGSIYFSVERFKDYGKLSGNKLEDMLAGARIEVDETKRSPVDFCLWKAAKPGEVSWDSPWGKGRPGWHIECSAMVYRHLGETLDIHGGGNDLIFPHHENEILQSEAVTGKPLAKYWMHNGMLQVEGEKMSKSLKNFFTVRDVMQHYSTQEVRFYFLNTHYRGPLTYSEDALNEAAAALRRLQHTYMELRDHLESASGNYDADDLVKRTRAEFIEHMDDDLNTRGAISVLFELARESNKLMHHDLLSKKGTRCIMALFEEFDTILGILPTLEKDADQLDDVMEVIIAVRQELRKRKLYDLADKIRDDLKQKGIMLEDTVDGVKWRAE
ncbi:MAG: cysteine--tRNA ligase [Methanomassiliicoccales archaeon]|nr:MAG: cysteine--tRNA ligase [Methanomassiliicoccales archaeon]